MIKLVEGDYARVVLEGRVTYASDDWVSIESDQGFDPTRLAGVESVEQIHPPLPPLPTTPGSVILTAARNVYYLSGGGWRSPIAQGATFPMLRPESFTILHDAGAVK